MIRPPTRRPDVISVTLGPAGKRIRSLAKRHRVSCSEIVRELCEIGLSHMHARDMNAFLVRSAFRLDGSMR